MWLPQSRNWLLLFPQTCLSRCRIWFLFCNKRQTALSRDVRESFQFIQRPKVALLTDTYFEINGVSASIKRMIGEAVRRDIDFTVITCLSSEEQQQYCSKPEVRRFIE